jgi:hypothetical protein
MKPTVTWILVADGAHARLLANRGPGKGVEQLEAINGDHRPDSELVRDGLGRSFESSGSAGDMRHAIEPRVDPHRELKRDFAKHLAKLLAQGLVQSPTTGWCSSRRHRRWATCAPRCRNR